MFSRISAYFWSTSWYTGRRNYALEKLFWDGPPNPLPRKVGPRPAPAKRQFFSRHRKTGEK